MSKRLLFVLSLLVVLGVAVLFGATPNAWAQGRSLAPAFAQTLPADGEPWQGGWLDAIQIKEVSPDAALSQVISGTIDASMDGMNDPEALEQASANGLQQIRLQSYLSEITFNPAEFNNGVFNPFTNPRIREAVNWLIDRAYIRDTFFEGLAVPQYVVLTTNGIDYQRYFDTVASLEASYDLDVAHAWQQISQEMESMGATWDEANRHWLYNGAPVSLTFLIRNDLPAFRAQEVGDYVADQLESVGFVVDRQYKSRSETAPLVFGSDPANGQWHLYTGAWGGTSLERDEGSAFGFFYTNLGLGVPLWQAYHNDPQFYEAAQKLWNGDYASWDERNALFQQALPLSMQDAARVWLVEPVRFQVLRPDIHVASSSFLGAFDNDLWPYTIRRGAAPGGTVVLGQGSVLNEPWNPIDGSSWAYDVRAQALTKDLAVLSDPQTGLALAQRVAQGAVVAQTGTPIMATLDWVTLSFQDTINVPDDAWVGWDAQQQQFLTAGDEHPEGLTATMKTTVTYPDDLFTQVKWHDGSPLSVADFLMSIIMAYDRADANSPIYDESAHAPNVVALRITSLQPLTIETYLNKTSLDAENAVVTWWPKAPWHVLAVSNLAEANGALAYSSEKASSLGVPWTDYVQGDSLDILANYLNQASTNHYVPYANVLSTYISQATADARYANLQAWYNQHGHFWVQSGPYYLDHTGADRLFYNRFTDFPDAADKWVDQGQGASTVATMATQGDRRVGENASVTFVVDFGQDVTGVDAADFEVVTTGSVSGASITSVQPLQSGNANASEASPQYQVTVDVGSGEGSVRLKFADNASVQADGTDLALPFTSSEPALVNKGSTFPDVDTSHWAWAYVERLYAAGLTSGYPDGTYRPENPVTRAEMAVFLLRAEHGADYQPSSYSSYSFSDIAGHWAADWIEQLHQEGFTNGYPDGTYRPNASATRAEMAVFLLRVKHGLDYQPPNYDTYSFSDIAGHWAANWIEELHQEGYTNGYPDGTYRPDNGVTRAEMAVFLCKVFDLP